MHAAPIAALQKASLSVQVWARSYVTTPSPRPETMRTNPTSGRNSVSLEQKQHHVPWLSPTPEPYPSRLCPFYFASNPNQAGGILPIKPRLRNKIMKKKWI
jgi:hypothetical protein